MEWDTLGKNSAVKGESVWATIGGTKDDGKTAATIFAVPKTDTKAAVKAVPTPNMLVDKTARSVGSFYYRVTATNPAGASLASDGALFYYAGVPTAPGTPTKTTATADQVVIAWTAAQENGFAITAYTVYYGTDAETITSTVVLAKVLTYTQATTAIADGYIYYQVAATNSIGIGLKSLVATVLSSKGPVKPVLTVTSADADSVKLSW